MTDDELLAIAKEVIEPKGYTDVRVRKVPMLTTDEGVSLTDYRAITAKAEGLPGSFHDGVADVTNSDEETVRLGLANWPTAEEARAMHAAVHRLANAGQDER